MAAASTPAESTLSTPVETAPSGAQTVELTLLDAAAQSCCGADGCCSAG
ncbi:hypothetical protein [Microbacterium sp.]